MTRTKVRRALELPDARDPEEVRLAVQEIEHELLPEAVRLMARGAVRIDPAAPRRVAIDH